MSDAENGSPQWKADCLRWRGRVLTGKHGHWCPDWDGLPIDETTTEWPCACAPEIEAEGQAAALPRTE